LRPQKFFVRNFFWAHMRPVRPPGGALVQKSPPINARIMVEL